MSLQSKFKMPPLNGPRNGNTTALLSPAKKCQCRKKTIIKASDESSQSKTIEVLFQQREHCYALSTLKLSTGCADFKSLNLLLETMIGPCQNHVLPDPKFLPLGHAHCEGFLRLHPPCEFHTYNSYLELLKSGFHDLLKRMVDELKLTAAKVRPKSVRSRRMTSKYKEYSEDVARHVETITAIQERETKLYEQLFPFDRLSYLFTPFTFMVHILEQDMLLWNQRKSCSVSKTRNLLIVDIFWKDLHTFHAESMTNDSIEKIFRFYIDCWHNGVQPSYLKSVAKLIWVISQATSIPEDLSNCQSVFSEGTNNLNHVKHFTEPPKLSGRGLSTALTDIGNGSPKVRLPAIIEKNNNAGHARHNFAAVLARSFNDCCTCEKECLHVCNALVLLEPVWLRFSVAAYLLNQEPTIEAVNESMKKEPGVVTNGCSKRTSDLRSLFHSEATEAFPKIGSKTNRFRMSQPFPKRMKLDPLCPSK